MNCVQCVVVWQERNEEMKMRLMRLADHLDEKTLNVRSDSSLWSPAQVIEHMVLTNKPYLQAMKSALQKAERTSEDRPVHYSFFGNFLCKAAGPDGNAPSPKALYPRTTTIPTSILQEWEQQQSQLLLLLNKAAGIDLSRVRVWNPLVRVIPMNLADCFALLTAHTERHIGQIQERIPTDKPNATPVRRNS